MGKYVYQYNEYINKRKLIKKIYPLIEEEKSLSRMFSEIISYLNIDSSSLSNPRLSIQIVNKKKTIESYLKDLQIDDISKKEYLIKELEKIEMRTNNIDLNELLDLINLIVNNKNIMLKLNNMELFIFENIKDILMDNQVFVNDEILLFFTDLLNHILIFDLTEKISNFKPIQRTKYYDDNNNIILKISMNNDDSLFSTLTDFSGEIYESLDFSSNEEAKKYQEENNIEEDLLEDVVSSIHFHAKSTVNDWYNELSIIKYRVGCIYINYGERLFIQNKKNNSSITPEEIEAIIHEFEYRGINNEFIKYVINELGYFEKTLIDRENRKKQEILKQDYLDLSEIINRRNKSLMEVLRILRDKNYGNNKTIFVKIKVISDTPITFEKNHTMILK